MCLLFYAFVPVYILCLFPIAVYCWRFLLSCKKHLFHKKIFDTRQAISEKLIIKRLNIVLIRSFLLLCMTHWSNTVSSFDIGQYIRENVLIKCLIVVFDSTFSFVSVSPFVYLDIDFFNISALRTRLKQTHQIIIRYVQPKNNKMCP